MPAAAAHTAIFDLGGAKAEVIYLKYSFIRSTDPEKGQPTKVVRSGLITLTLRSDEPKTKGLIIKWMGKQDEAKKGKITIFRDAEQKEKLKEIEFDQAYVVEYEEEFDSESKTSNTRETFKITAQKIKVEGAEFNMKWPI